MGQGVGAFKRGGVGAPLRTMLYFNRLCIDITASRHLALSSLLLLTYYFFMFHFNINLSSSVIFSTVMYLSFGISNLVFWFSIKFYTFIFISQSFGLLVTVPVILSVILFSTKSLVGSATLDLFFSMKGKSVSIRLFSMIKKLTTISTLKFLLIFLSVVLTKDEHS